jgi:hypothetical protein
MPQRPTTIVVHPFTAVMVLLMTAAERTRAAVIPGLVKRTIATAAIPGPANRTVTTVVSTVATATPAKNAAISPGGDAEFVRRMIAGARDPTITSACVGAGATSILTAANHP